MTQYNITANYTSRSDPFNGIKTPSALSLSLSLSEDRATLPVPS